MAAAMLPRPQAALVTQDGRPTAEFYNFLLGLDAEFGTDYAGQISAIAARLAALEEGQGATLRGIGSVQVRNGVVTLLADEDNPTGSAYYGTDMHGSRGFHPVINAFDTRYGIEKDTPTGYVVLGTLDDPSELPEPPGAPLEAYLIDGNYWVSDGTEWSNAGPPTNIAVLGLMRGIDRNDGLLWNDTIGDYEVAPIVRNPMTGAGDMVYQGVADDPSRLPIGSDGDRLEVVSGEPAWVTPAYGSLIQGANVTLTGNLANRLVGPGDVAISASGGGGGGGYPFVPPPQTGWSWVNQGGATITSAPGYQLISGGTSPFLNCRMRTRTAPASPYTITAGIELTSKSNGDSAVAVFWRNSASGALTYYGFLNGTIQSANYNSPSSFNSLVFNHAVFFGSMLWLRLEDDGANRSISYSSNGYDFILLHTSARTDFITPDEVGFMTLVNNNMTPPHARLVHWQV